VVRFPLRLDAFRGRGRAASLASFKKNVRADWSGGRLTPGGFSGTGETPQELQRRGGSPPAPRKASARSGNQPFLHHPNKK
jgi:hypothetical protein